MPTHSTTPPDLRRRVFLQTFAGTGLATTLFPGVLWARWRQEGGPESPITTAMIAEAEKVAGLSFTTEEREAMRRGLAENVESFEQIRALAIPNEVAPAVLFEPAMPGVEVRPDRDTPPLRLSSSSRQPRPDTDEELAFASVATLARLVRSRQVSAEELARLYLDRLERYDPALHMVVTATGDAALSSARQADREIAAGGWRGPLHGIPWGAKDLLATRGYPTSWGAAPYRGQSIETDATVVQRLEAAGSVLVAKLTLGALAMGDYWFGGRTRTPWNPEEGSSGSSAGPGAATAAGCVGFSIGTETRGSIVSPSTRSGVSGLRPTFGRVSRHGAMALSWTMDKIGPMCRSAEDCALVFAAIHGADGLDPSARTLPFDWDPHRGIDGIRVGVLRSAFEPDERYENRDLDLATLDVLERDLGIELVDLEMPEFPVGAVGLMLDVEAAAAFDELTLSNRDDELTRQTRGSWPNFFRTSRLIPAVEYVQAARARTMYMRLFSEAIRDVDVFVVPSFRGGMLGATNLTGHPCVVVPNGFVEADGHAMPRSISFIGGLYRDADCLRLAHAYQQVTDWHRRRPDMAALAAGG